MKYRTGVGFLVLALLAVLFSYLTLTTGSVDISLNTLFSSDEMAKRIFWEIRFPRCVAAILGGASLAVAGLAMQRVFQNPLAGPFVLGISSGASFGVALSLLAGFSFGSWGVLGAAALGASVVMLIIMGVSQGFNNSTVLLVVGLLVGYFIDALISLLVFCTDTEALRVYVSWSMGSFGRLTIDGIKYFLTVFILGITLLACSIRYLNALPMGEFFARGLGINVKACRNMVLLSASLLAAATTAFCGPVAFVGIAVPHLGYMIFRTSNHRVLLPGCALCGVVLCLAASLFQSLPLNAVLSLVGVPVVLWVVIKYRR